jgi:hypothetical protein
MTMTALESIGEHWVALGDPGGRMFLHPTSSNFTQLHPSRSDIELILRLNSPENGNNGA